VPYSTYWLGLGLGAVSCLNALDLFSGIGGFSLGLESAGFRTVAFCEIEQYCRAVLRKHWPDIPIHDDIRALDGSAFAGTVDLICGGYPCQPFSSASRGQRTARDLWPEMLRIIRKLRPKYVIAENVQEQTITDAIECLKGLGYKANKNCISSAAAGADHQRDRWWAIAHPHNEGEFYSAIHAEVAKLPKICGSLWGPTNYARAVRVSSRLPHRMDRLRALGNSIVPQIAQIIGQAIMTMESATKVAQTSFP
jgi:DNA (cytosine-5)-methyltransferase 1